MLTLMRHPRTRTSIAQCRGENAMAASSHNQSGKPLYLPVKEHAGAHTFELGCTRSCPGTAGIL